MTDELDRELAAHAAATGQTQAEVVREALGRYLTGSAASTREALVGQLEKEWQESRQAGFTMGGRMPTKEELHEREKPRRDR
jgi:hypothetical protein